MGKNFRYDIDPIMPVIPTIVKPLQILTTFSVCCHLLNKI